MKLTTGSPFLPSTLRATQWASETLQILQPAHPLSDPAALYEALKSTSLEEIFTRLKGEPSPPPVLLQVIERLLAFSDAESATPSEWMTSLRHSANELGLHSFQRAIDRWFYRAGFHSIRSLGSPQFGFGVKQLLTHHNGGHLLTDAGDVFRLEGQQFVQVSEFESLEVQQISAVQNHLVVLDEQGTVWGLSEGQAMRHGQWEKTKSLLATASGPIIRMANHVIFKGHIFSISARHDVASDGELLLTNGPSLTGYRLVDGSRMDVLAEAKSGDEQMMADAIHDFATTEPGLRLLLVLKFWTQRISHTYRMLQQVGDVLYVSQTGDHAISLNEDTLMSWSIFDGELNLVSEIEITDAWSVNGVVPIHPSHQAVVLQTASGISAIDFEHQLEVRMLVQPAFAIRVYANGQPFRFWMSTGEHWHQCRFDRQGISYVSGE